MILEGVDLVKLSKLTFQQVEHVTCLECCKYYIAPETATCGHTLCHSCWKGQRACPTCKLPLERKALKLNLAAQTLTEHVHQLVDAFEQLFNIKLDEIMLYTPNNEESEKDPTKHVKDWLASSQNHFSAPINSEFSQIPNQGVLCNELSSSMIQIHTETKNTVRSEKVLHISVPQDDWDKIETLPDTEDLTKNKENVIGPMDIEPYVFDDNEYSTEKPRRSSRRKDFNSNDHVSKQDISADKPGSKDSGEYDKKSNKLKQNWGNVKKMRKEFSKLNKINKNKLNVSIEMCKKAQGAKPNQPLVLHDSQHALEIDENTPGKDHRQKIVSKNINCEPNFEDESNNKNSIGIEEDKDSNKNSMNRDHDNVEMSMTDINKSEQQTIANNEINNEKNVMTSKADVEEKDKVEATQTIRMPFLKKGHLYNSCIEENCNEKGYDTESKPEDNENIEITIKIGNTIANILIKKKEQDVKLKVNTDRGIQTTLGPHHMKANKDVQTINIQVDENTKRIDVQSSTCNLVNTDEKSSQSKQIIPNLNKSTSTKKNTASAETATVHFEITESIEKELSNVMECMDQQHIELSTNKSKSQLLKENPTKIVDTPENMEYLNDVDIFCTGSIKDSNVQLLASNHAPSEILNSTVKTYKQKNPDKRERDANCDDEMPSNKKQKLLSGKQAEKCFNDSRIIKNDSGNYDSIMGQVFANIDADIEHSQKTQNNKNTDVTHNSLSVLKDNISQKSVEEISLQRESEIQRTSISKPNEENSENVFSISKKDEEVPASNQDMIIDDREESTPYQEQYDSDKSIVEETPQKNLSFLKLKQKNLLANQSQRSNSEEKKTATNKQLPETQHQKSIINLSDTQITVDTSKSNRDLTVIETGQKQILETPLTINKFVDQIKHKSTPVAKKSLNFEPDNDNEKDPEQTLCPSSEVVARTTQEIEFLSKAFENTPANKPLAKSIRDAKKICLAGSCLTSPELAKLKSLCLMQWAYSDKYTKEVTHLVVGVDEENKSQRSVKYMCSLAAGKWIVSFDWIEKMLKTRNVVDEVAYEALDSTGEPGPRRSRIASNCNQKLFQGIIFYCMPPFSVLDVNTLQSMLEAAGGQVVREASGVRLNDSSRTPALLLAEPEHTQEDRFIYLSMDLGIVPVNYEWALNCLGSYTLGSIQELLLCPASLLPAATAKWPHALLARED